MMYLGDFAAGATVRFFWNSNGQSGASITRGTDGAIKVYKNGSTTERASASGITDTEDFDSRTGVHYCAIDLSDNADSGFYAAGNDYAVMITGAAIDGQTVNAVLAHFSVSNRPVQGLASGVVTAAAIAADAITAAKIADGAIDAATFATGAITAAAIAADAIGASELAADAVTEIQSGLSTLTAAGVRTAVGLSSANLDTQLSTIAGFVDTEVAAIKAKTDNLPASPAATGDIPTAAQNADALLDLADGVETGRTPRQTLRLVLAALVGKLSGAGGTAITIRDTNDTKNRISATVDADGNRASVTLDPS